MARCVHGYERSVVLCARCGDKKPAPVKRSATGASHPGFKDLTGFEKLGAKVLFRLPNHPSGTACWKIRLPCGHEVAMLSIVILHPRKKYWHCSVCQSLVCAPQNPDR